MRVRAIAVASDRSSAVGSVELECTEHGLYVGYQGVGAFSEGYAPAAVTHGTAVTVPYGAIEDVRLESDRVFLKVDPKYTPHDRLLLASFSAGDGPDPQQRRRRRLIVRVGIGAALVVTVLVASLTLPNMAPRAGAIAGIVVGCLAASAVLIVGLLVDRLIAHGGPDSDEARIAWVSELAAKVPNISVSRARPLPDVEQTLVAFQNWLPRSTSAIALTLTGCLLAAVLTSSWLLDEHPEPKTASARSPSPPEPAPAAPAPPEPPATAADPAVTARSQPQPQPQPAPPPATGTQATLSGSCTCARADSVLWRRPIPRLSTLLIERRERPHKDHVHLELELAAVNNGDENVDELTLHVQFFERDPPPSKKRYPTKNRPLYFEGPLLPGQAIKWHVDARGTEFEVENPIHDTLAPSGEDAAPTNRLAMLLEANHRPVRLHGAMMLAFLSDPRARKAALDLKEALRQDEAPYLDRLVRALGDVRACAIDAKGVGPTRTVSMCVHNTSDQPQTGLGMRVRALDRQFDPKKPVAPPPIVIAEKTIELSGQLAPKTGAKTSVVVDTTNTDRIEPESFEVFVDRYDLLY